MTITPTSAQDLPPHLPAWQALLISLVSLTIALVILEAIVRQFVPRPAPFLDPQVLSQNSRTLKWQLKPNQRSFTIDAPVRTNSHGFRGHDFDRHKSRHVFRILTMGDSITFGYGVRLESLFVTRLEHMLNERHPSKRFEVINMGVPGYNTRQQLIALREQGLQYDPDLVIVSFYWNDILDNKKPTPWEPGFVPEAPVVDERGHVKWAPRHAIPKPLRDTLREWRTFYLAVQRAKILKDIILPSTHPYSVHYRALLRRDDEFLRDSWTSTEARLQELLSLGQQQKFRMVIVIFPDEAQVHARFVHVNYQANVKNTAAAFGVPCVDLLPEFKRSFQASRRPFLEGDAVHPNDIGHEITARALFSLLTSSILTSSDIIASQ